MKTCVKICGIKFYDEAVFAFKNGADFVGLLVDIPKTFLSNTRDEAKNTISKLKGHKTIVLTIENRTDEILKMVDYIEPWGIQLLRPNLDLIINLKRHTKTKIISVVHVVDDESIDLARSFYNSTDYILLDSKIGTHLGGTGKVHDWRVSKNIVEESPVPVFLAGGLNIKNVSEAIELVKPYSVDVESSLVDSRGLRDLKKVKEFIDIVKNK